MGKPGRPWADPSPLPPVQLPPVNWRLLPPEYWQEELRRRNPPPRLDGGYWVAWAVLLALVGLYLGLGWWVMASGAAH